jgi:predicted transcriptional regulator
MEIDFSTKHMELWECFSSPTRVRMIELLRDKPMNLKDLAEKLEISTAIVSRHVQQLESAGLLTSDSAPAERGRQKICRLLHDRLTIIFRQSPDASDTDSFEDGSGYRVSIPIGHYANVQVKPTCGLASSRKYIGMRDDPRYFVDPERMEAQHLWFASGFVEYRIPNYLVSTTKPTVFRVTLEIGSEAPGYREDWPSDIEFFVNDVTVGKWTSPGDYGSSRGLLTPPWWIDGDSQHGSLKTLMVTEEGAFIDGVAISNVSISELGIRPGGDIRFRISASESATYPGGVSLYGKQFGNYPQDIEVMIRYE